MAVSVGSCVGGKIRDQTGLLSLPLGVSTMSCRSVSLGSDVTVSDVTVTVTAEIATQYALSTVCTVLFNESPGELCTVSEAHYS